MAGLSREEIIGKTDYDFYSVEMAEKFRQDDLKVMRSGKRYEMQEENKAIDGSTVYLQTVKTPVYDLRGNPIGIQAIFWDVTEREKLQESLQQKTDEVNRLREEI